MNVISEEPVTLAEVLDIFKKKEKQYKSEEREFSFEQKRVMDHAKSFTVLSKKDSISLMKGLGELPLELHPEWVAKIVDLLPESVDDVRAIFAKERFKYDEAEIKQITDLVDQYR